MKKFELNKIYKIKLSSLERIGFIEMNNKQLLYNKAIFRDAQLKKLCPDYPIFIKYLGENYFEELFTGVPINCDNVNAFSFINGAKDIYDYTPLLIRSRDVSETEEEDKKIFSEFEVVQLSSVIRNIFKSARFQYELEKSLIDFQEHQLIKEEMQSSNKTKIK